MTRNAWYLLMLLTVSSLALGRPARADEAFQRVKEQVARREGLTHDVHIVQAWRKWMMNPEQRWRKAELVQLLTRRHDLPAPRYRSLSGVVLAILEEHLGEEIFTVPMSGVAPRETVPGKAPLRLDNANPK